MPLQNITLHEFDPDFNDRINPFGEILLPSVHLLWEDETLELDEGHGHFTLNGAQVIHDIGILLGELLVRLSDLDLALD